MPSVEGGHQPLAEDTLRLTATQHTGVVDRVATHKRRTDERQQLPTQPCCARPLAQVKRLIDDLLDPEPTGKRARQQQARVRDHTLIIESKREPVQLPSATPTAAPLSRHHMGDLLSAGLAAASTARLACSGGHSVHQPGRLANNKTVDPG